MITKPEQAIPMGYAEAHNDLLDHDCGGDKFPLWFTAAETAKIAKAYLAAYLKEKRALLGPDSEHKKAAANLRAWRSKFKEWGI